MHHTAEQTLHETWIARGTRISVLTCYCLSLPNFLSTGKEDNIPLGRIHILVFQEENAIYTIFLKC